MTSPQTLWRGNRACSNRATRSPRCAQNAPAVVPAGPPPTTITSKSLMTDENDAGVDAAETEAVGQDAVHAGVTTLAGNVVKVAVGVRLSQIQRRRQVIMFQRKAADGDLNRPRCTEWMGI